MKKGLIALVLSAFISNAYAVKVDRHELEIKYLNDGSRIACYETFRNKLNPHFFHDVHLNFVPSDNHLKEWSMRDELKYIEKFEYMKNAEALASAIKKDLEVLEKKLDAEINISKEKLEDNLIIDIRDIVDWNTDGTEIALSLANGNELYTTQTQNIYAPKFKNYVGFNEIQSVEETETEIHITAKDGNVYTIEK